MKSVRKRLTYANVMSSIAVFLVVAGGSAFAAVELGKESVGTKELAKESVNLAKIKKATKNALKGATGPAGAKGATGATGPQGPQGLKGNPGSNAATNIVMRTGSEITVVKNDFTAGEANCLAGEKATGGGVYPVDNVYYPKIVASYPLPNPGGNMLPVNNGVTPTGWRVWVASPEVGGAGTTVHVIPYVICVSP